MAANINQYITSQTLSYIEESDKEKQRLREDLAYLLHMVEMNSEHVQQRVNQCQMCQRYISSDQWLLNDANHRLPFKDRTEIECFGCYQRWCWGCVKTKQVQVKKVDPQWDLDWDWAAGGPRKQYCIGVPISGDNDTYDPSHGDDDVAFSCARCMNFINSEGRVEWSKVPLFHNE